MVAEAQEVHIYEELRLVITAKARIRWAAVIALSQQPRAGAGCPKIGSYGLGKCLVDASQRQVPAHAGFLLNLSPPVTPPTHCSGDHPRSGGHRIGLRPGALTEVGELHSLTDWQVSEASEDAELEDFCHADVSRWGGHRWMGGGRPRGHTGQGGREEKRVLVTVVTHSGQFDPVPHPVLRS